MKHWSIAKIYYSIPASLQIPVENSIDVTGYAKEAIFYIPIIVHHATFEIF